MRLQLRQAAAHRRDHLVAAHAGHHDVRARSVPGEAPAPSRVHPARRTPRPRRNRRQTLRDETRSCRRCLRRPARVAAAGVSPSSGGCRRSAGARETGEPELFDRCRQSASRSMARLWRRRVPVAPETRRCSGSTTSKRAPPRSESLTAMRPLCISTNSLAIASPSPVPPRARLAAAVGLPETLEHRLPHLGSHARDRNPRPPA